MDTSGGATIVADTRAGLYYRRRGIVSSIVRGRPRVRFSPDSVQIREEHLRPTDTVNLVVYPELNIRSEPWAFWGVVLRKEREAVILRQLSGQEKGTLVRIPFRYFADGRVYQKVGISDDE
jgi:hypothetical protein